jgi:hypothetical protein
MNSDHSRLRFGGQYVYGETWSSLVCLNAPEHENTQRFGVTIGFQEMHNNARKFLLRAMGVVIN